MSVVEGPECGEEISSPLSDPLGSLPKRRGKVHPVTWIVAIALLPILVWDVRQTVKESKLHATPSKASPCMRQKCT